jgi:hypothetical protein
MAFEQKHNTAQVHKAKKVRAVMLITHNQSTEVLQPGKQRFEFPATAVASQRSAILRGRRLSILLVRRDHLNAVFSQCCVQRITVIGLVADQPFGLGADETPSERVFDKGDLMR